MDSSLQFVLGAEARLAIQELDTWELNGEISDFLLLESCGSQETKRIGGKQQEPFLIHAASKPNPSVTLRSSVIDLHVTPKLCRSLVWLVSTVAEAPTRSATLAASEWQVTWNVPLAVHVGPPWQLRSLVLEGSTSGTYQKAECSGNILMTLQLEDKEILEPLCLDFSLEPIASATVLRATAHELLCTLEVPELVSLVRMGKGIMNEIWPRSEVTKLSDLDPSIATYQLVLSLGKINLCLSDPLLGLVNVLRGGGWAAKWDSQAGGSLTAVQAIEVQVDMAEAGE